jgi:DNA-binding CsgD family transcriptional regulator
MIGGSLLGIARTGRIPTLAPKLTPEEIVTLQVLKDKGQSNIQIAQALGVSEGAIRYHLRRRGAADGRLHKPRKADALAEIIDHWVFSNQPRVPEGQPLRPINVRGLFDWLCGEHDYRGSYKSVLRFVRASYPRPRLRPFRRVETPPGAHYGKRLIMVSRLRSCGQRHLLL